MRTLKHFSLLFIIIMAAFRPAIAQTNEPWIQDGKVFIKIKDHLPVPFNVEAGQVNLAEVSFLQDKIQTYGITSVRNPFPTAKDVKLQRTFLVEFTAYHLIDQLIHELYNEMSLEYSEKVPIFRMSLIPNDTYYGDLSSFFGTVNANWHWDAIGAEAAWDITTGSSNIVVAVLDNGMYTAHPDLDSKFVAQVDLADFDSDPTPPTMDMSWSHGTHTSGLVGAETNNGTGVSSIGYNVSLMAVKVGRDSDGALIAGYEGIVWAADHGADVISMSWGSTQYFITMQNTVNYAYNKGCVLVAASGNDGNNVNQYPASLHHVISVASVDEGDGLSSFSCYGPNIDVCAPGGSASAGGGLFTVLSTSYSDASFLGAGLFGVTGKYEVMGGTSMACPIVAGLCGLMLSVDSTLTPEKLELLLKASCDNIDAQNPSHIGDIGAGRVNAWRAVQMAQDSMVALVADFYASNTTLMMDDSIDFFDQSIGNVLSWSWSFPGASPATSSDQDPQNIVYNAPGLYPVSLTVTDSFGSNTETKTNFILVKAPASSAWIPQATGFASIYRGIRNISIVNPQVVWASAYDGSGGGANILEFSKTTDGGATWTAGSIGIPTNCSVSELFAVSADTAWVATYGNTTGGNAIFRTVDGGATWNAQTTATFSGTAAFPNTIYFWDADNGLCMGDPNGGYYEMYTTTDGGDNWVRVPQASIPAPLNGEYGYNGGKDYDVVGNTIWFGTNMGRVFRSDDRGLNWTVVTSGQPEVTNITFGDENNGILQYKAYNTQTGAITAFEMMVTTDGGLTWNDLNYTGDIFKSDIDAVPGHPGMYIATGSSQNLPECGSAFSLDYGQSWTMIDDSVQYTCVSFYDDMTGWAGGFNTSSTSEGIWKWMGLIRDSATIIADFIASETTINIGETVDFTDLSLGLIDSWDWTFNGGTPASSTTQHPSSVLYSTAGNYAVTLTCANQDTTVAKTKTAYIHVIDASALEETQNTFTIELFPNPVADLLNISAIPAGANSIDVFNAQGKLVIRVPASVSIETASLPSGVYLLQIKTGEGIVLGSGKFIRE